MIVLLSPAKTLDFSTPIPVDFAPTNIPFPKESAVLAAQLKQLSVADVAKLMKVSADIAALNHERFAAWQWPYGSADTRAAIYAFMGEAYRGLDAYSLSADELHYAQHHLVMLSGLYGALRPMDAIMPYRLEMGTRLQTHTADNLYSFWGDKIRLLLQSYLKAIGGHTIINLASQEYFKAVNVKALEAPLITPVFMQLKGDAYKQISVYAKKARGLMSRYIIDNRIEEAEALKSFDIEGYAYHESLSTAHKWVFTRSQT